MKLGGANNRVRHPLGLFYGALVGELARVISALHAVDSHDRERNVMFHPSGFTCREQPGRTPREEAGGHARGKRARVHHIDDGVHPVERPGQARSARDIDPGAPAQDGDLSIHAASSRDDVLPGGTSSSRNGDLHPIPRPIVRLSCLDPNSVAGVRILRATDSATWPDALVAGLCFVGCRKPSVESLQGRLLCPGARVRHAGPGARARVPHPYGTMDPCRFLDSIQQPRIFGWRGSDNGGSTPRSSPAPHRTPCTSWNMTPCTPLACAP